jgi:hypothetical protein
MSDHLTNEKDILLAIYAEQMSQARWHEEQRERVSTLVFTGSGVLLALTAFVGYQQIIVYFLVFALGLIGTAIALKHYERNRKHVRIGRAVRNRMAELFPLAAINETVGSDFRHDNRACSLIEPVRLYVLWLMLTGLVAILGLALLLCRSLGS